MRLYFQRTTSNEEVVALVIRRLHRYFARLEEREQRRVTRGNAQIALRDDLDPDAPEAGGVKL